MSIPKNPEVRACFMELVPICLSILRLRHDAAQRGLPGLEDIYTDSANRLVNEIDKLGVGFNFGGEKNESS